MSKINALTTKLALGLVGIAGVGTAALFFTKYLSEPVAITLSKYTSEDYKYTDKFGGVENNRKVLVADIEDNKEWWEWVYKNKLEPLKKEDSSKIHNSFKSASAGYGTETTAHLNKICSTIYGKNQNDVEDTDSSTLKSDVLRFCSIASTLDPASTENRESTQR